MSDWVKFARFAPDLESARQLIATARNLVRLTQPVPDLETSERIKVNPIAQRR